MTTIRDVCALVFPLVSHGCWARHSHRKVGAEADGYCRTLRLSREDGCSDFVEAEIVESPKPGGGTIGIEAETHICLAVRRRKSDYLNSLAIDAVVIAAARDGRNQTVIYRRFDIASKVSCIYWIGSGVGNPVSA